MAERERLICASTMLAEQGDGYRFKLDDTTSGFLIRYQGRAHGYVNQCAHVPVELDWQEGEFFDLSRQFLVCATHGAHYAPDSGYCVMGPCIGQSLQKLEIAERDGSIYLINLESES